MIVEVRATQDKAAALAILARVEAVSVDGATLAEMTAGAQVFDLVEDGRTVGAVALDLVGTVATITAAASDGRATLPELAAIERMCKGAGADTLRMVTRRPGLVRKMTGAGYRLASAELIKGL